MPHLIVEYSANLEGFPEAQVLDALNATVIATGQVQKEADLKSRTFRTEHFVIGIDPTAWGYWQRPANAEALQSSVFSDVTSVMDFGIIAGAMLAASLAGRFAPSLRIPLRSVIAAVVGGGGVVAAFFPDPARA